MANYALIKLFFLLPTVKLLLDYGADINVKDNYGRSAQDLAKQKNYNDIYNLLNTKKSGFWQCFESGFQLIYDKMKQVIPERFLKFF